MKYAFITLFVLRNRKLKVAEEWLIYGAEDLKKLMSLFIYTDFQVIQEYENFFYKTAFVDSLNEENKIKFFLILDEIAEKQNDERLEPFTSFDRVSISFENHLVNNFFTNTDEN